MTDFQIRPVRTLAELHAVEEVQRVAWHSDELDIVPLHMLLTVAKNGGVLLGAFAYEGSPAREQLIGFVFGFIGTRDGHTGPDAVQTLNLKHCSHQMGILPAWQSQGVGYALKAAQREVVLKQGLRLITWTYDPLESKNAHLNILKLGAVCNAYVRNLYGELRDDLNRGLATDRFQVDWWIASGHVAARLDRSRGSYPTDRLTRSTVLNPAHWDDRGLPICADHVHPIDGVQALIEFPSDFQAIRKLDGGLAQAWRLQLRSICEDAFARGYSVIDYVYEPGPPARSGYVLQQVESSEAALDRP